MSPPVRPSALRVLNPRWVDKSWIDNLPAHVPPAWYPYVDDVPATRADCPTTRPCPHVRCRHHLWLVEGSERPGRRTAQARRADDGRFVPEGGEVAIMPPSILGIAGQSSCTLDLIDQRGEGMDYDTVGRYLGITGERARQICVRAHAKLIDRLAKLGVTLDDAP